MTARQAHGLQHMAPPALLAGGAFRYADAAGLKEVHEHLAPVPRQGDAEYVQRAAANDEQTGILCTEPLHGVFTQLRHARGGLGHLRAPNARGLAEGADEGHGLRARAAAVLLGAADYEGTKVQPERM